MSFERGERAMSEDVIEKRLVIAEIEALSDALAIRVENAETTKGSNDYFRGSFDGMSKLGRDVLENLGKLKRVIRDFKEEESEEEI